MFNDVQMDVKKKSRPFSNRLYISNCSDETGIILKDRNMAEKPVAI